MLDHTEYSHSSEATETEIYSSTTPPATVRKKRSKNKIRFSDKQIKSLESMFETESRLEPLKKLQLARELGLQPRQVSIWFQNKRARWKSKQLERDYNILRASYNNLASSFDALKKEQQALLTQLQKLNDRMQKPLEQTQSCTQNKAAKNKDNESENEDTNKSDLEVKPSLSTERSEHIRGVFSNGDSSIIREEAACFCLEDQPGLLNFAEHAGGFLTSPEDWGMLNSDDLSGQSTSDYQLWDF